jgi:hypothetical protein
MLGVVLFDIAYSAILSRLAQSYCNVFEIRAVIKIMEKICFVWLDFRAYILSKPIIKIIDKWINRFMRYN